MSAGLLASAVVVGAAGGFGRAFVEMLIGAGKRVAGVDLAAVDGDGGAGTGVWLAEDASRPTPALTRELSAADIVLLCLPERSLFPALAPIVERLSPGALLADITSVKTRYATIVTALRGDIELCSLEPLFAPDVGFDGQQVAITELRPGPRSAALWPLLEQAGAELIRLDADGVDRQAAASQVAVHAALLAYGHTLGVLDPPVGGAETALQRAVLTLVARVVTRDPEVYWHIQRDNPHAAAARAALAQSLRELDELIAADDLAGFRELMARVGSALAPRTDDLAARSAAVVSAAASPVGSATAGA